jgi:hypothetical protein
MAWMMVEYFRDERGQSSHTAVIARLDRAIQ